MDANIKKLLWYAYDLDQQGEPASNIYMMGLFIAIVFARNLGYSKDRVYGELLRQWTEVDNQLNENTMGSNPIEE
mgnify:FL=1|jgi:hypothetical protein|tara:strand:- start:622 stop:846 length:225 start_codon:yes stop_codon:yes gene_type:complete